MRVGQPSACCMTLKLLLRLNRPWAAHALGPVQTKCSLHQNVDAYQVCAISQYATSTYSQRKNDTKKNHGAQNRAGHDYS